MLLRRPRRISVGRRLRGAPAWVGSDEQRPEIASKWNPVYMTRDVNDENVVIAFRFFDGSLGELRHAQEEFGYDACPVKARGPDRGLAALSPGAVAVVVVASAVVVALIPAGILFDWDSTRESRAFVSTPQFILWVLILCGQAAIWVGAAGFAGLTLRGRWRDLQQRQALGAGAVVALASAVVLTLLAVVLLFGTRLGIYAHHLPRGSVPSDSTWPLAHHTWKMTPLVGTAMLIGGMAIAGMWLTTVAFGDLARHATSSSASVTRFIELRTELTALLALAGVLVGLATLSTGALREAVIAVRDKPVYRNTEVSCLERKLAETGTSAEEIRRTVRTDLNDLLGTYPKCTEVPFDQEYVLAYGLLFTGVLGLAFAPSYLFMRRAGAELRDRSYPLPEPQDPKFFEIVERRNSFDVLLQTNLSATATFKAGVAILTPLAASLVSTNLPS